MGEVQETEKGLTVGSKRKSRALLFLLLVYSHSADMRILRVSAIPISLLINRLCGNN
jgi:hypothetical protein